MDKQRLEEKDQIIEQKAGPKGIRVENNRTQSKQQANTQKYLESKIDGIEVDLDIENGELRIKHGPNPIKRPSILGKLMGWIDYKFFIETRISRNYS